MVGPLRSGNPPSHEVLVTFFNDRKKWVFLSPPPHSGPTSKEIIFFMCTFPKKMHFLKNILKC